MQIPLRFRIGLKLETWASLMLMAAALLALIANNTPLSPLYDALLSTPMSVRIAEFAIEKPLLLWINDGLMAVFFFLVGLEIKREVLLGELSTLDKAALPVFAAVGGMAVPALIYVLINRAEPHTLYGWAIPTATDIAFALGILGLLGRRVPVALKVLLLALAIIDDLGAILIIALFYTSDLSLAALGAAGAGLVALVTVNLMGVRSIPPYALIGLVIWAFVVKSGVHATLAGVLIALTVPIRGHTPQDPSPLHRLEHDLSPTVAVLVLPLFAFANAGVSFQGLALADLLAPMPLGIALGLFLGKQIGVFGATFAAVRLGAASLPANVTWRQIYGLGCLAGVGFTMSLFIGTLAFDNPEQLNQVRIGVLLGSVLSGCAGFFLIATSPEHGRKSVPA